MPWVWLVVVKTAALITAAVLLPLLRGSEAKAEATVEKEKWDEGYMAYTVEVLQYLSTTMRMERFCYRRGHTNRKYQVHWSQLKKHTHAAAQPLDVSSSSLDLCFSFSGRTISKQVVPVDGVSD